MNNSIFDNKYSNAVVNVIGTIIRTFERSLVVFWDGLRMATVHGTPSLVGFFAAIAPLLTPAPMAAMTAIHMMQYLHWEAWQAWLMAAGLEVVGFPLWVFTTEAIFIDGWKGTTRQISLAVCTGVYQVIIISINAILSWQNGDGWTLVGIFLLACFVPALGGMAYSYSNRKNEAMINQEKQELLDAQLRAEEREFKLKQKAMKQGIYNPFAPQMVTNQQVVEEVKEVKEKHASDYREKAIEFIEKFYGTNHSRPTPKHLTERFNLEHSKNKGYMSSLIKEICDAKGWN